MVVKKESPGSTVCSEHICLVLRSKAEANVLSARQERREGSPSLFVRGHPRKGTNPLDYLLKSYRIQQYSELPDS